MSYRIDCSPKYGILIWLEAPCGIKQPLMRWDNLEEVKTFAESILDFYNHRRMTLHEADRKDIEEDPAVADRLLRQALGDDDSFDQAE